MLEIEAELQDIADLRVNYDEHPDEDEGEISQERCVIDRRLRAVDHFQPRNAR